jgi:hypothetical protein
MAGHGDPALQLTTKNQATAVRDGPSENLRFWLTYRTTQGRIFGMSLGFGIAGAVRCVAEGQGAVKGSEML